MALPHARLSLAYQHRHTPTCTAHGDQVYRAIDLETGDVVAAKKIKMDNEKEGFPITAIREIKILSQLALSSPPESGPDFRRNIITLREIVRSGSAAANNYRGSIYMIFDYMDHDMTGLLERSMREGPRFTLPQIKCYVQQLFRGLALLAQNDVLHRDLKNSNLLIDNSGALKIGDFGLARFFRRGARDTETARMTNRVITLWYRPPELFLGTERYGTEIDVWSAGCIMAELIIGKALFTGVCVCGRWMCWVLFGLVRGRGEIDGEERLCPRDCGGPARCPESGGPRVQVGRFTLSSAHATLHTHPARALPSRPNYVQQTTRVAWWSASSVSWDSQTSTPCRGARGMQSECVSEVHAAFTRVLGELEEVGTVACRSHLTPAPMSSRSLLPPAIT